MNSTNIVVGNIYYCKASGRKIEVFGIKNNEFVLFTKENDSTISGFSVHAQIIEGFKNMTCNSLEERKKLHLKREIESFENHIKDLKQKLKIKKQDLESLK